MIQFYVFYLGIKNFEKMISYRNPKVLQMSKKMTKDDLHKQIKIGESRTSIPFIGFWTGNSQNPHEAFQLNRESKKYIDV